MDGMLNKIAPGTVVQGSSKRLLAIIACGPGNASATAPHDVWCVAVCSASGCLEQAPQAYVASMAIVLT